MLKKMCKLLQNHSELKVSCIFSMSFYLNLNYSKNVIKPCWLVGQNSVGSKKPNTMADTILKDFQIGTYNVLISTDVVQSSLDISQCSFTLRYTVNSFLNKIIYFTISYV